MNKTVFSRFQKAASYRLQLMLISCTLVLLMGGLAAAQVPTLSVAGCDVNSAGRGEQICVPAILATQGTSVASVGFTLAYDCAVLTLPNGSSDVQAGAALTGGQSVSALVQEDGTCAVEVLVTPPIIFPIPSISDGELVLICFTVQADAPFGCSALTFVALDMGDTQGRDIPGVGSIDGGVLVSCQSDADCDDGEFCNGMETCSFDTGECMAGTPVDCDDGDVCTDDTCDEAADACMNEPVICDDGDPCTTDSCDSVTGCVFTPVECPAGQQCDPADGICKDVVIPCDPPDCDDGVACTVDTCDAGVCVNTPNNAACDDGQFCNGVEICDPVNDCQPGTPVDCEDGVACTADNCDEDNDICVNTPNDELCDDGDPCTTDSCNPATGCVFDPVMCEPGLTCDPADGVCKQCTSDADCDDGVFCNGIESCDTATGLCGAVSACPPAIDGCVTRGGFCDEENDTCVDVPDDSVCDDGDPCNGTETCDVVTGGCLPGTPPDCSDGIDCTTDSCDSATGCVNEPDDAFCDDDLFCTGEETCDPTAGCVSTGDPCPENTVCNEDTDSCDPVVVEAEKVTLCHKGKNTITVGAAAVAAHLRHGDTLGPCPE